MRTPENRKSLYLIGRFKQINVKNCGQNKLYIQYQGKYLRLIFKTLFYGCSEQSELIANESSLQTRAVSWSP